MKHLLLLLLLPFCSGHRPTGDYTYAGTTVAYYPKHFNTEGFFVVELRVKTNSVKCYTPDWICTGGTCGYLNSKSSYDVDPNSKAEYCQQEGIITQWNRSTAPFLLKVWAGPYFGWAEPFSRKISALALTLVELRKRSDTKQPNSSPQTTILPIFRVSSNCQRDIRLLAFDPDGDLVKCRYADNKIHSEECNPCTPPSVLTLSPTCTLSFSPTDNSSVGLYAVLLMMEDFPRTNIRLTLPNGTQEEKTTNDIISKIPVQFVVSVEAAAPSCTEGVYLPRFVDPTPAYGAQLNVDVSQTLQINIKAEASESVISELVFSGPHDMNETNSGGQYILSWTPSAAEDGQSHPVCFSVQAVLNGTKYTSELRCVIVLVGNTSPDVLRDLMKFWVGWELPPRKLNVEVVTSTYPVAHTCFFQLKLPSHYQTYKIFHQDLMMALSSVSSGFGLV